VPRLQAIFETTDGIPNVVLGDKYKHFCIMLSVLDVPEDVMTLIYQLDDTYLNPLRMVTKGVPNFQESITAYGDYSVRIAYRPMQDPNKLEQLLSRKLSDALMESYQNSLTEPIRLAIDEIIAH
jgi:hypothetical protein